jgi:hypothetical protein
MRLSTQAEESVNFFPSLVDGLVKRPPMRREYSISNTASQTDSKIYFYNRDDDHQYVMVFYTDSGGLLNVHIRNVKTGYISTPGISYFPLGSIKNLGVFSVADYVFFWDKKRKVEGDTAGSSERWRDEHEALVYMKQISYDTRYEISVTYTPEGGTAKTWFGAYETPKNVGTVDNPPAQITTEAVLATLQTQLFGDGTFLESGLGMIIAGNVSYIYQRNDDGGTLRVKVSDSRGSNEIKCVMSKVQSFSDLPDKAPPNYYVEVIGDRGNEADNYYVRFIPDAGTASTAVYTGVWAESVKTGQHTGIKATTMPYRLTHTISSEGVGVFAGSGTVGWEVREVGDEDSAPNPLFVDHEISDMFLYRNRLGFLSDDSITLSAAGDLFNFYPQTVLTVTDSDPISISASGKSVTNLKYALPFQDALAVFCVDSQFIMETQDILSPATATLKVTTTYDADMSVSPVSSGNTLFFCTPSSGYTGVREYYTDNDSLSKLAPSVTAHAPKYIEGVPRIMTVSNTEDTLIIGTDAHDNILYMYKYYWSGSDKLQAAWCKLELPKNIRIEDATFFESVLYLVIKDKTGGKRVLCTMDFSANAISTLHSKTPYIDWRVPVQLQTDDGGVNVYVGVSYVTSANDTDYVVVDELTMRCYRTEYIGEAIRRKVIGLRWEDAIGMWTAGTTYESRYVFSEQFPRTDGQNGQITLFSGRLQFLEWMMVYGPSAYFRVEVDKDSGQKFIYPFTGTVLGKYDALLGKYRLSSGEFKFPVKGASKRVQVSVVNDTHLPCSLLSAEWEGNYQTRTRRI